MVSSLSVLLKRLRRSIVSTYTSFPRSIICSLLPLSTSARARCPNLLMILPVVVLADDGDGDSSLSRDSPAILVTMGEPYAGCAVQKGRRKGSQHLSPGLVPRDGLAAC